MMDVRNYIRVSGRVQGVGFRYFTQRQAESLGLVGYVRNLPDGDVELEIQGSQSGVESLSEAVRVGPSGSRVTSHQCNDRPIQQNETGFEIRY